MKFHDESLGVTINFDLENRSIKEATFFSSELDKEFDITELMRSRWLQGFSKARLLEMPVQVAIWAEYIESAYDEALHRHKQEVSMPDSSPLEDE